MDQIDLGQVWTDRYECVRPIFNGALDMDRQPGFTENEQLRFRDLLLGSGLVDSYRHLHPKPVSTVPCGQEAQEGVPSSSPGV